MLDKSLPYFDIIMKLRGELLAKVPEPVLPEGYSFRFYRPGDEYHWARLETLVQEFPSEEKALAYYRERYMVKDADKLPDRCVFVVDANDIPVATTTAWFGESSMGHGNWLQWISSDPAHQGKGLGRAVIARALRRYTELGEVGNVYLHTQTWSHKAVYLYNKFGFQFFLIDHVTIPTGEAPYFRIMKNSPEEAFNTLEGVYTPEYLQSLRDHVEYPESHELADGTPWM